MNHNIGWIDTENEKTYVFTLFFISFFCSLAFPKGMEMHFTPWRHIHNTLFDGDDRGGYYFCIFMTTDGITDVNGIYAAALGSNGS